MDWLNKEASENIPDILVTLLTYQFPMDWLNEEASENIHDILVTLLTSQSPIG